MHGKGKYGSTERKNCLLGFEEFDLVAIDSEEPDELPCRNDEGQYTEDVRDDVGSRDGNDRGGGETEYSRHEGDDEELCEDAVDPRVV